MSRAWPRRTKRVKRERERQLLTACSCHSRNEIYVMRVAFAAVRSVLGRLSTTWMVCREEHEQSQFGCVLEQNVASTPGRLFASTRHHIRLDWLWEEHVCEFSSSYWFELKPGAVKRNGKGSVINACVFTEFHFIKDTTRHNRRE